MSDPQIIGSNWRRLKGVDDDVKTAFISRRQRRFKHRYRRFYVSIDVLMLLLTFLRRRRYYVVNFDGWSVKTFLGC
jgi:hypothetical protein